MLQVACQHAVSSFSRLLSSQISIQKFNNNNAFITQKERLFSSFYKRDLKFYWGCQAERKKTFYVVFIFIMGIENRSKNFIKQYFQLTFLIQKSSCQVLIRNIIIIFIQHALFLQHYPSSEAEKSKKKELNKEKESSGDQLYCSYTE